MALRRKHSDPIDRAISDLNQKIATVQRQMREVSDPPAQGVEKRAIARIRTGGFTDLVKGMLGSSSTGTEPPRHTRQDLFDVTAEPLKELEAEPIAFAKKAEPDLFAPPAALPHSVTAGPGALETAQVVPPKEKLAHYLGAGSIRSYKPLKRAQRQTRNRFFMWLGLSFFALWIIWFVIR